MRIRFTLLLLLIFGVGCLACQAEANQQPQPRIGVVDGERLMRDSAPGRDAMKFVEAQQNAVQEQLAALQDKLEKNPEDEAAQKEFQKVYTASIQKLQTEAQNAANLVQDAIKRTLNAWREKNGYDMLVYSELMASYAPAVDVTKAVLDELDKQKIEFKPVAAQPAPSAPAAQTPEAEKTN